MKEWTIPLHHPNPLKCLHTAAVSLAYCAARTTPRAVRSELCDSASLDAGASSVHHSSTPRVFLLATRGARPLRCSPANAAQLISAACLRSLTTWFKLCAKTSNISKKKMFYVCGSDTCLTPLVECTGCPPTHPPTPTASASLPFRSAPRSNVHRIPLCASGCVWAPGCVVTRWSVFGCGRSGSIVRPRLVSLLVKLPGYTHARVREGGRTAFTEWWIGSDRFSTT